MTPMIYLLPPSRLNKNNFENNDKTKPENKELKDEL